MVSDTGKVWDIRRGVYARSEHRRRAWTDLVAILVVMQESEKV